MRRRPACKRFGALRRRAEFRKVSDSNVRMLDMDRMTERRRDRRIPLGTKVGIKLPGNASAIVGTCIELGVGGMTIHSSHIPRMDEVFEVAVLPPEQGGAYMPLHARVRVRRCDGLEQAGLYEMGVEIIEVIR